MTAGLIFASEILAQSVQVPGNQLQLQTTSSTQYLFRCALSTNSNYQWQVRACASNNTCSKWATGQTFTTSRAPEVASPYDADWQGAERIKNAKPFFDWCPAQGAASYILDVYQEIAGTYTKIVMPDRFLDPITEYNDDARWQEIKKANIYGWNVTACPNIGTPKENCWPPSQFWKLDIGAKLNWPTLLIPSYGSAVNIESILSWSGDRYAAGYLLHIEGPRINQDIPITRVMSFLLSDIWENWLRLDSSYYWRVASCEGSVTSPTGLNCIDPETGQIQWSATSLFITTGAPPTNVAFKPSNESGQVGIPLTIDWNDMPGAASYTIEILGIKYAVLDRSEITLNFEPPFLQQGQTYGVSIKTCADKAGLICGAPTNTSFTVAPLAAPTVSVESAFIPSIKVKTSEVFGANTYQYQLIYTAAKAEETGECKAMVGSITELIVQSAETTLSVRCTGQYTLQVRGCIDESCAEPLGWGQWGALTITVEEQIESGGLVPCGRGGNDPATPWDERQPCNISHIFLLIKILLDFLMFRLVPLVLVLLTIYSGVVFYFALPMGIATPIVKIKSLWKAVGIGLLVIFFAWLLVTVSLNIFGFKLGEWYKL